MRCYCILTRHIRTVLLAWRFPRARGAALDGEDVIASCVEAEAIVQAVVAVAAADAYVCRSVTR